MRSQRESLESILERAIREAQASPKAEEAIARYGKIDVSEVIHEIVRLTEEGLSRGSNADEERKYLRSSLIECGVDLLTASLFTQTFFKEREPKRSLLWQIRDVFKGEGW